MEGMEASGKSDLPLHLCFTQNKQVCTSMKYSANYDLLQQSNSGSPHPLLSHSILQHPEAATTTATCKANNCVATAANAESHPVSG